MSLLIGRGYHTLLQCLGGDRLMMHCVAILSAINIIIYLLIARQHARSRAIGNAGKTLKNMVRVFVLCAVAGYGFNLLKIFYPAWHLWCVVMVILIFQGARLVLSMNRHAEIIYQDLDLAQAVRERILEDTRDLERALEDIKALCRKSP